MVFKTFAALFFVSGLVGILGGRFLLEEIRSAYLESLAEASQRQALRIVGELEKGLRQEPADTVLNQFQRYLESIPFDEAGFVCLMDAEALVVSHPDTRMVGMSMSGAAVSGFSGYPSDGQKALGDFFNPRKNQGFLMQSGEKKGGAQLVFQVGVEGSEWVVSVHSDLEAVQERLDGIALSMQLAGLPLLMAVSLLGTAAVRVVGRRYESYLEQMNEVLEERVRERTQELQRAKDKAESADRLKAEFLALMSHEYRTPLNAVQGFSSMLEMTDLDAEQMEFVGEIKKSGDRLLRLLERILHFAAIEAGRASPGEGIFLVSELVDKLCAPAREIVVGKGLNLKVNSSLNGDPAVQGDIEWIGLALSQIVDNAVKFTARGEVCLDFALVHKKGGANSFILKLDVTDTGEGIAPEVQPELFALFRQADSSLARRHEGVGIGLIMAQRMLERLSGQIRFSSHPGQGSTFHVETPLLAAVEAIQEGAAGHNW